METIAISKFKATCLALRKNAFGCMKGTIHIKGDSVSPLPKDHWEVLISRMC